jgi:hypothetical protein
MLDLTPEQRTRYKEKYHMKKTNYNRNFGPGHFTMTFEEWYMAWVESGHIDDMGARSEDYVMTRRDESTPLTKDNYVITTKHEVVVNKHRGLPKNRGRSFNNGIKRSEETKEKQRLAHLGNKHVPSGTPIQTPDGVFPNIHAAAEHYGINVTAIHYFKRKYPNEYYYLNKD